MQHNTRDVYSDYKSPSRIGLRVFTAFRKNAIDAMQCNAMPCNAKRSRDSKSLRDAIRYDAFCMHVWHHFALQCDHFVMFFCTSCLIHFWIDFGTKNLPKTFQNGVQISESPASFSGSATLGRPSQSKMALR